MAEAIKQTNKVTSCRTMHGTLIDNVVVNVIIIDFFFFFDHQFFFSSVSE